MPCWGHQTELMNNKTVACFFFCQFTNQSIEAALLSALVSAHWYLDAKKDCSCTSTRFGHQSEDKRQNKKTNCVFFLSLSDMVYLEKKEKIPGGKKWITTLIFSDCHTWCCSWELLNSSGTWKWCWSSASLSCFHHCQTGRSRNLRPA